MIHLVPVLTVIMATVAGCASLFQDIDDKMQRNRFRSDYEHLERAISVYDEGKFEAALTTFKPLASTSGSVHVRRKARLGEICCRLMLARSAGDYNHAIGMWHDFTDSVTTRDSAWDPVLLDPLIVRKGQIHAVRVTPSPEAPPRQKANNGKKADVSGKPVLKTITQPPAGTGSADIARLKKKADSADELQRRLDAVTSENQSLKEKIKALEAIDQNIQKKKTQIAEPGE